MRATLLWALVAWSPIAIASQTAYAQVSRLAVLVEQIAGENIYIRAGTEDGVVEDDTLFVYDESGERLLGTLLVVSATRTRSVVTFAGQPFSLTRGTTIQVALDAGRMVPGEPEPGVPTGRIRHTAPAPTGYPLEVSGRLSLQFNALETRTRWLSNEEVEVDRTFATPAIGLRMAVAHLPGDLEFTTNLRGSYRYSSNDLVDPAQSIRVYQVSVRKSFEAVPIQFQAGRFYSRYEIYSGYWDGLSLHYGDRGLGFGVVAGFQPERANEEFSTTIPKYTAFVDFNHVGTSVSYYTDVSFHQMKPNNELADRTFVGWSQRLTAGRVRLSTDLQVDRDSDGQSWVVTRLHASGSIPLTRGLSLRARYALDEPRSLYSAIDFIPFRRQQATAGIGYWARGGSFNLDVTANRFEERDPSYTVSSSLSVTNTGILGLGLHGAGSMWSFGDTRATNVSGGLDRTFGSVQARASYQLYRTKGINNTFLTHTGDLGLVFPLTHATYATVQARLQRGDNLSANSVFVNLWTSF